jgi:peptidoglycan L-alanyl-D-glutamate endopeptidase CwlK
VVLLPGAYRRLPALPRPRLGWPARHPHAGAVRGRLQVAAVTVAVLICPPAAIVLFGERSASHGFDMTAQGRNAQITELLRGEQLRPPAPLPPLVFSTPEARIERPMLATASRNWQQLDPAFSARLLAVFKLMRERHGYEMVLLEGYRSPERQQMLASMGPHVTNAGAFQSLHQYGMAADCAFLRGGKLVISEKDEWAMKGYELYGALAEEAGLRWGGRWAMRDYGHIELRARRQPPAGGAAN